MALTKSDYATFITNYLRELPRIYGRTRVPGICPITVDNWLIPLASGGSVPNAHSLHKLAVNTGHDFFMNSNVIWAAPAQPTYCAVSESDIVSQRVMACIQAYERWPGDPPQNDVELHVPNFSTLARILNQFPETTFACDRHGIRFDGWENYRVLRKHPRSPQSSHWPTNHGIVAEQQNMIAESSVISGPLHFGVTVTIAGSY